MGIGERLFEAMRSSLVLNEKLTSLTAKVERMDSDLRAIHTRLVRMETIVEMAANRPVMIDKANS